MPWPEAILFIIPVMLSLRTGSEAFVETHGAISGNALHFGKLLVDTTGSWSGNEMASSVLRSARPHGKAKLRRLAPSVHCGNDSMTLRIKGSRMPHFLFEQEKGILVPLSAMPASCGFSMRRERRDVSLVAPYQGCNVQHQGGRFVLPLYLFGSPVQASCPDSPRIPEVSCVPSGMVVSLCMRAEDVKIKVAGSWQPLLLVQAPCSFTLKTTGGSPLLSAPFTGNCWQRTDTEWQLPFMLGNREVTLSCPLTLPTTATTTSTTTTTTTITTIPPVSYPTKFPKPFPVPWWFRPLHPDHFEPTVHAALPTTTPPPPATTAASLQDSFPNRHPYMRPMPTFNPWFLYPGGYPIFSPYMYNFQIPGEAAVVGPIVPMTPAPTTNTRAAGYPEVKPFVPPGVSFPLMPPQFLSPYAVPGGRKAFSYGVPHRWA